jgi:hypothetical protein
MTEEELLSVPVEEEMEETIQRKLQQTPMNRHITTKTFAVKSTTASARLDHSRTLPQVLRSLVEFPYSRASTQTLVPIIVM